MLAGADGVNFYAWGGTNKDDQPKEVFFRRLKEEIFTEPVPPPERPWKDTPNYGLVCGQVFDQEGAWVDGATITLDGGETQLTDGTGFFAFTRIAPGRHVLVLTKKDGTQERGTLEVEAGKAARLNFGNAKKIEL
jgi:hypothetical protein